MSEFRVPLSAPRARWTVVVACALALPGFTLAASAAAAPAVERPSIESALVAVERATHAWQIALSPDGRRVAYTISEPAGVRICVTGVDKPGRIFQLAVELGGEAPGQPKPRPVGLVWLHWISVDELLYVPQPVWREGQAKSGLYLVELAKKGAVTRLASGDEILGLTQGGQRRHLTWQVSHWEGRTREVIVEARGAPAAQLSSAVYAVSVDTRQVRKLDEAVRASRMLSDRGGMQRVALVEEPDSSARYVEYRAGRDWRRLRAKEFAWSAEIFGGERSIPLGFALDPDVLYYASNVGRDTYGIYTWSLAQERRLAVIAESADRDLVPLEPYENPLIYDPETDRALGLRPGGQRPAVWFDPEWARLAVTLQEKFPHRQVDIRGWDRMAQRFLVFVHGERDLGRYFVYVKEEDLLVEVARTAPGVRAESIGRSVPFQFQTRAGHVLHGVVTQPVVVAAAGKALPVVLLCSPGLYGVPSWLFAADAQVFARLGYLVVQVDHRGRSGWGSAHRNALPLDTVAAADLIETTDWLARTHAIDGERVFAVGTGFGGFLALRTLQVYPTRIRAAIALNAPLDPPAALPPERAFAEDLFGDGGFAFGPDRPAEVRVPYGESLITHSPFRLRLPLNHYHARDRAALARKPVVRAVSAQALSRPMLSIVDASDLAIDQQSRTLRARERDLFEYVQTEARLGTRAGRLEAFRAIDRFLRANQSTFDVKVGPLKEVP